MKKRDNLLRYVAVGILFCVVCVVYVGRLIYLQVAGQDYYTMSQPIVRVTRTVPIQAIRGEIYDKNGVPLVTNRYTYDLQLEYSSFPRSESEKNAMVLGLLQAGTRHDCTSVGNGSLPVAVSGTSDGLMVSFRSDFFAYGGARYRRFAALIEGLYVDWGHEEDAHPASPLLAAMSSMPYSGSDPETAETAADRMADFPPVHPGRHPRRRSDEG